MSTWTLLTSQVDPLHPLSLFVFSPLPSSVLFIPFFKGEEEKLGKLMLFALVTLESSSRDNQSSAGRQQVRTPWCPGASATVRPVSSVLGTLGMTHWKHTGDDNRWSFQYRWCFSLLCSLMRRKIITGSDMDSDSSCLVPVKTWWYSLFFLVCCCYRPASLHPQVFPLCQPARCLEYHSVMVSTVVPHLDI